MSSSRSQLQHNVSTEVLRHTTNGLTPRMATRAILVRERRRLRRLAHVQRERGGDSRRFRSLWRHL